MALKKYDLVKLVGNYQSHKEALGVLISMLVVTLLYEFASNQILSDFTFNWYEFVGTWTGLTTVWMARTQNILTWPIGIVSAGCLGYFFSTIGLPGQQWLNWGYFLIIQFWAWPNWAFGGKKATELKVTTLNWPGKISMLLVVVLGTFIVYEVINYISPGSQYPIIDSIVVASSIVAQYLLGLKKVESWFLWLGPVNVLSIILFFLSGAYIVMALYVAFLIHAVFAIRSWRNDLKFTSA
jgi:nicotinamide mononucleotide transporter